MLPGPQTRGQGGPLQFPRQPSDRSTPHAPGGSWAPAPGSLVPSVAFAHPTRTRLLLGPARAGVFVTTLQASRDVADWPVARPHQGRRCSASTAGSRPPPGAALPGTLASPRTGLTPAGCHELVARIRRLPPFSLAPELLDARGVRKVGSRGVAVFVNESAESVAPLHFG